MTSTAPVYVDALGRFYDAAYRPVAPPSSLEPVPFPSAETYDDGESFVEALTEWAAKVTGQLQACHLPVNVSRVWPRPRMPLVRALGADETETTLEEISDTVSSPRFLSPVATPRSRTEEEERDVAFDAVGTASKSHAWRGVLVPMFPQADLLATDEEYMEATRRWAALVAQIPDLPPHPSELAELLEIGAAKAAALRSNDEEDEQTETRFRVSSAWNEAIVQGERGWMGIDAPMAKARAALIHECSLEIQARTQQSTRRGSRIIQRRTSGGLGRHSSGGLTPILSRVVPGSLSAILSPSTNRKHGDEAPSSPATPTLGHSRSSSIAERIAVVDMFRSDSDDDSDSSTVEDQRGSTKVAKKLVMSTTEEDNDGSSHSHGGGDSVPKRSGGLKRRSLSVQVDVVPDVVIGSNKADQMARLRAQRLFGNVFVMRMARAMSRKENFFHNPVLASIAPIIVLDSYPTVFGRDYNDVIQQMIDVDNPASLLRLTTLSEEEFASTLRYQTDPSSKMKLMYRIPQVEKEPLDLQMLYKKDDASAAAMYRKQTSAYVAHLMCALKWDAMVSFMQPPKKYMAYAAVKNSLFELLQGNSVLTDRRVLAWLREHHAIDYWLQLLREPLPMETSVQQCVNDDTAVEDQDDAGALAESLPAGTTFGALLFRVFCVAFRSPSSLGNGTAADTSAATGVVNVVRIWNGAASPVMRTNIEALMLKVFGSILLQVLPNASLSVLHFFCACYASANVNAPQVMPLPEMEVTDTSGMQTMYGILSPNGGNLGPLFEALYKDYYLSYLEQWKGTKEMPNSIHIGVRGVHATLSDQLKQLEVARQEDIGSVVAHLMSVAAGTSRVLALHATFLASRLLGRPLLLLASLNASMSEARQSLAHVLFIFCAKPIRRLGSRFLVQTFLQGLMTLHGATLSELLNRFYASHLTMLIGHLTASQSNFYVDILLVPILLQHAGATDGSMVYAMSPRSEPSLSRLSKVPTDRVFTTLYSAMLTCDSRCEEVQRRLLHAVGGILRQCPDFKLLSVPNDLSPLVTLAAKLSGEPQGADALQILRVFLSKGKAATRAFHPETCRGAWRRLADLCRGVNARYLDGSADPDGAAQDVANPGSSAGAASSASKLSGADATAGSTPVLYEVNRAAWQVVTDYMRFAPSGIPALIDSRLLGTLLSAVAPHSRPGVAGNALLALSNLLRLDPKDDMKSRDKELRPLVAFLSEKRFLVQVHLLYCKQEAAHVNFHALVEWANTLLTSPLAKDLLKSSEDAQYREELERLRQRVASTP